MSILQKSLVFYVMFCRSLFVLLSFFFWSLSCRSFFDLRLLITPLISLSFSYICISAHFFIVQRKEKVVDPFRQKFRHVWTTFPERSNLLDNRYKRFCFLFFCVICLFFQEQIDAYMILYTQWFSTQKLQCKKVDLHTF